MEALFFVGKQIKLNSALHHTDKANFPSEGYLAIYGEKKQKDCIKETRLIVFSFFMRLSFFVFSPGSSHFVGFVHNKESI